MVYGTLLDRSQTVDGIAVDRDTSDCRYAFLTPLMTQMASAELCSIPCSFSIARIISVDVANAATEV